jgi:hypothetical protein
VGSEITQKRKKYKQAYPTITCGIDEGAYKSVNSIRVRPPGILYMSPGLSRFPCSFSTARTPTLGLRASCLARERSLQPPSGIGAVKSKAWVVCWIPPMVQSYTTKSPGRMSGSPGSNRFGSLRTERPAETHMRMRRLRIVSWKVFLEFPLEHFRRWWPLLSPRTHFSFLFFSFFFPSSYNGAG